MLVNFIIILVAYASIVAGASKEEPHTHQGVLEPYTGLPLPVQLTRDQQSKLDQGEAVTYNERDGQSAGFGVVIQDINASGPVTFNKIRDLKNYHKMVPHVKGVDVYEEETYNNGTTVTGAKFNVGMMGFKIGYFLKLRHEPKYDTLTWTLDYRYNSDFDDNVGHWQVMAHPEKKDWTRVLYSCKIKLFPWVPSFAINYLTTKALTEATGWVKRESEQEQRKIRARIPATPSDPTDTSTCTTTGTCNACTSPDASATSKAAEQKGASTVSKLGGWFKNIKGGSCRVAESTEIHENGVKSKPKSGFMTWKMQNKFGKSC